MISIKHQFYKNGPNRDESVLAAQVAPRLKLGQGVVGN